MQRRISLDRMVRVLDHPDHKEPEPIRPELYKAWVVFLSRETEYYVSSIMKPQTPGELLLLNLTALLGTDDEDRFRRGSRFRLPATR